MRSVYFLAVRPIYAMSMCEEYMRTKRTMSPVIASSDDGGGTGN